MDFITEDIEKSSSRKKEETAIGSMITFLEKKIEACKEFDMPMEKWAFQQALKQARMLIAHEENQIVNAYNKGKSEQGSAEDYLVSKFK